ncbi:MAG: hypothetical protein KKC53_06590 [Actinobacteria bacterium]|nr:hypothetical protein [Actinomycetota bacterium]
MLINFSLIIPELFIFLSFLLILLFSIFVNKTKLKRIGYFCLLIIVIALILTFIFRKNVGTVSSNFLEVNELSNFFRYFFLFSGIGLVISIITSKIERSEIYVLILISIFGAMSLGISSNLLTLLLFLEIVMVSSYFVSALKVGERSWISYLRYVICGIISSFLLIYFLSLIYGLTGSLSLNISIINIEKLSLLLIIASIVLIVIMMIRLSLFPFNFWFPPFAKDSGFFTTLFFSILFIPANLLAIQKIFEGCNFLEFKFPCHITISFVYLTIIFLNIGAIFQKNIWRFLVFSNVVNICFILVGFLYSQYLRIYSMGIDNITLIYLLIYLISTSALIIGLETYRIYKLKTNWVDFLEDIRGGIKISPILALSLIVILISQIGIPGTAGFLVKYSLIKSIIGATGHFDFEISIFLIINYLVAFYYYGRIILSILSKPKTDIYPKSKKVKLNLFKESSPYLLSLAFIILCSIIILALGIYGIINPTLSKILFPLFK